MTIAAVGTGAAYALTRPSITPARIGTTLTLTGDNPGDHLSVTVLSLADPAPSPTTTAQPLPGTHYIALHLRLTATGPTPYEASPAYGAVLIDTTGQQHDAETTITTLAGPTLPSPLHLDPTATTEGVLVFAVPDTAKPAKLQLTLDSGLADQTGQWSLTG